MFSAFYSLFSFSAIHLFIMKFYNYLFFTKRVLYVFKNKLCHIGCDFVETRIAYFFYLFFLFKK